MSPSRATTADAAPSVERLRVPLAWVISGFLAVAGTIGTATIAIRQANAAEGKNVEQDREIAELKTESRVTSEILRRVEAALKENTQALNDVKDRLKK